MHNKTWDQLASFDYSVFQKSRHFCRSDYTVNFSVGLVERPNSQKAANVKRNTCLMLHCHSGLPGNQE